MIFDCVVYRGRRDKNLQSFFFFQCGGIEQSSPIGVCQPGNNHGLGLEVIACYIAEIKNDDNHQVEN